MSVVMIRNQSGPTLRKEVFCKIHKVFRLPSPGFLDSVCCRIIILSSNIAYMSGKDDDDDNYSEKREDEDCASPLHFT